MSKLLRYILREPLDLHRACLEGDQSVVDDHVTRGVAVDVAAPKDSAFRGKTPLQLAAQYGHTSIVRTLLSAGADPVKLSPHQGYKASAFCLAASRGQTAVVQQFIEAGADVNMTDSAGRSPLIEAAEAGDNTAVQLLIAAGADVNLMDYWPKTALHYAASLGHAEIVKQLLAAGADVCATTDEDATALDMAVDERWVTVVEALLQHGNIPQEVLVRSVQHAANQCHTALSVLEPLLNKLVQIDRDKAVEVLKSCKPSGGIDPMLEHFNHPCFVKGWLSGMAASDATSDQVRQAIAREKKELEDERRNVQQLIVQLAAMQRQQQATNGNLQKNSDSC